MKSIFHTEVYGLQALYALTAAAWHRSSDIFVTCPENDKVRHIKALYKGVKYVEPGVMTPENEVCFYLRPDLPSVCRLTKRKLLLALLSIVKSLSDFSRTDRLVFYKKSYTLPGADSLIESVYKDMVRRCNGQPSARDLDRFWNSRDIHPLDLDSTVTLEHLERLIQQLKKPNGEGRELNPFLIQQRKKLVPDVVSLFDTLPHLLKTIRFELRVYKLHDLLNAEDPQTVFADAVKDVISRWLQHMTDESKERLISEACEYANSDEFNRFALASKELIAGGMNVKHIFQAYREHAYFSLYNNGEQ